MEDDFFKLYERQGLLAVEIGHNSIADWSIHIYWCMARGRNFPCGWLALSGGKNLMRFLWHWLRPVLPNA